MLAKARQEAAKIVAEAREEADALTLKARRECDDLKKKADGDIKMASIQALAAVRQKIEQAITARSISEPIAKGLNEKEFLQSIIKTVVSAFNPASKANSSLDLILPESKKQEMDTFVKGELAKCCNEGLNVSYDKNVENGFKVGPKGSGYYISFTDKSFENIISDYLRPKTKKLLFGE
jgi:V/A-type H+-transporting ATPase subunit E